MVHPVVEIATDAGTIVVELHETAAPGTVANFLGFVESGAYDGGRFYRTVTPDNQPNDAVRIAVIQGGVPETFDIEAQPALLLERTNATGLRHLDGTISMARRDPDSAKTEFFICVGDQPELDFGGGRNPDGQGFAAFGQVIEGMAVVRAINGAPRDEQHLTPPIRIASIKRRA
ncbi:MAG: peptidylprolyl isomerase [Thermomicrobiales bacterium]|nr:peptidylprolyl isomerase [Thermomicrobiales bacterium]